MNLPRADLVVLLDALELALPDMLAKNPDEGDFWPAFAGESDAIEDRAGPDDQEYVRGRIDCMLKNAGMIPGEDEGEQCK